LFLAELLEDHPRLAVVSIFLMRRNAVSDRILEPELYVNHRSVFAAIH